MNVGLLSQWFDPEPGPAAIPADLARGLARKGHQVTVLTGFPNYPTGQVYPGYRMQRRQVGLVSPGVRVTRVPIYPSHDRSALRRAANYLSFAASAAAFGLSALERSEALWVYNSPATVGPVAQLASRRFSAPFILHVMDLWPDSVLDSALVSHRAISRTMSSALTAMVKRTYQRSNIVAYTSPGQAGLLEARGVDSRKLRYIPVWADEEVFYPRVRRSGLLGPGLSDARTIVMYAGSLGFVQQLDGAVRAVASLAKSATHLVFVGSGVAEPHLRALAHELKAENIHFLGRRMPAEMGEIVSSADIQLVSLADTPLLRVTMPSKMQSIMASARPILAMCAGDAGNVVNQSGAGFVVQPGDEAGLVRVLGAVSEMSGDELIELGSCSRQFYDQNFGRDRAIRDIEQALNQCAG